MSGQFGVFLDLALRWTHFAAALIWIGHNYVNVVLTPRFVPIRPADFAPGASSAELESRLRKEHGTFRYAALVTWIAGALMLWRSGHLLDAVMLHGYAAVIGTGAWIATFMVLNLFLVLWPHQKKVLGLVPAGPEERARCARITFLSSRTNTILSIPVLFFMGAATHGAALF
jgi:uncharacterized membrane protein